MAVVVETTIGDFTVDLYTEERPQSEYTPHLAFYDDRKSSHSCAPLIINEKYCVCEIASLASCEKNDVHLQFMNLNI